MLYTLELRDDGSLALYLGKKAASHLMQGGNTRVVLSFGTHRLHAAILNDRIKGHHVRIAKAHHKKWGIQHGQVIEANVEIDTSTYQFELPESLSEVLHSDPDAMEKWLTLTAGKQRSMIYQISKVKSLDLQIKKSLLLAQRLKEGFTDPLTILKAN
jgi:uncharacterized protein YdeI (YjbR/CyaY-like superfamily)